MKLKLYSGEEIPRNRLDALRALFNLNAPKTTFLLKEMTENARFREGSGLSVLSRKLGISPSKLSEYLPFFTEVVFRILGGRASSEVQQDLIKNGFPKRNVRLVFSKVNSLPEGVKKAVRFWAMEGETHDYRNHIHGFGHGADVRTMIDNGSIVGILPVSNIRLRTSKDDSELELELDLRELSLIIVYLERARQELEKATTEFKRKLGETVVSPTSVE